MTNNITKLNNRIIDSDGNVVYFSQALMELMYRDIVPSNVLIYPADDIDVQAFNKYSYQNYDDVYIKLPEHIKTHQERKDKWFYPEKYDEIDLEEHLLKLCKTDKERDRVKLELNLYKEKGFEKFLRFCIFFSDKIEENDWVVGVGRGSSCCSFILYLKNIHLVNSLEYDLDIKEFLK